MSVNRIINNVRIATPLGNTAHKGKEMSEIHFIDEGLIVIVDGMIEYAGKETECPPTLLAAHEYEYTDAGGRMAIPGFVDSHTHLIFGGFRPDEFSWRLKGESYMSIMQRGGGIQSTVNATRNASDQEINSKTSWLIGRMIEMGVTTVEAKSGYGLDIATEKMQLEAIRSLQDNEESPLNVVATFLGAHAVPIEYKGRTGEYVDYLIGEMLPAFKGLASFCDVFCEKNVFELEDSRRLLEAAAEMGYKLKLHADEIVTLGGAELAADLKAISADHLLHVSDEGIRRMAEEGVVATLLPLTAFALKEPFAPARKFIDAGAAVALATDLNPGSCFSGSIPLTIALACIHMGMSIEETLTALTLNGAAALDMADKTGSLETGKQADIVILEFDNLNYLPYYVGMNCVRTTLHKGRIVYESVNPFKSR
ncbi:MAG: imidazolonepropionase [Muribaculaceae bacterium]|nr:imidazolonepropionase [Muribaculaceae bacterium]